MLIIGPVKTVLYMQQTNTQIDDSLKKIADYVIKAKLEVPALFFLETHKPLCTIAHTATLALQPIAAPFFGIERVQTIQKLFENRQNIEKLMQLIEARSN